MCVKPQCYRNVAPRLDFFYGRAYIPFGFWLLAFGFWLLAFGFWQEAYSSLILFDFFDIFIRSRSAQWQ